MRDSNEAGTPVEFLIAEFEAQQEQVARLEESKSSRINFFLLLVAAVIAGTSGFLGPGDLLLPRNVVLALAAMAVLALGLATLNELVRYSEAIVSLYRRAGRIRSWFAHRYPEIVAYLAFSATDEQPAFDVRTADLSFRGGDSVVLLTNSVAASVLIVALTFSVLQPGWPVALVIVAVVAPLSWSVQQWAIRARLRRADALTKKMVHFPLGTAGAEDGLKQPE